MPIPRIYTLKEAVEAFQSDGVTVKGLRAEVHALNLKSYRVSDSPNAKILVVEEDLLSWLYDVAGRRQVAAAVRERGSCDR